MSSSQSHIEEPTMQEILDSITNESLRIDVMDRLKKSNPESDEIKGVKLFLENNGYDFQRLAWFLQSSEIKIENIANKNKQNRSLNWLKVAAVLLPLIVLSYFVFNTNSSPHEKLYLTYYEKELGLPVVLSNNYDKTFNESMNLFRNEDYKNALKGFTELLAASPKNDTLNYFVGVCNLELDKYTKAISYFTKDYSNSVFKESTEYRLAMVYIKKGEIEKSEKVLKNISNHPQHKYSEVVEKLLKEELFN